MGSILCESKGKQIKRKDYNDRKINENASKSAEIKFGSDTSENEVDKLRYFIIHIYSVTM